MKAENNNPQTGNAGSSKKVSVRYIVNDVDEAIRFYSEMLGFEIVMHPAEEFAILSKDQLILLLSKPGNRGGGGQDMADGTSQEAGGWNRFEIVVQDLDVEVEKLKKAGCRFRNDIISGVGGRQILLQDPSGNLVELFQYFKS